MTNNTVSTGDLLSPKVYGLILDSKQLRSRLLPGGPIGSPYEVLNYQASLVLADPKGHQATVRRIQQIRFLQDGVSAILDHYWGDGVLLTDYQNTAGLIGDSFKDQGVRHLVIDLARAMARGETLTFAVERTVTAGFTDDEEWLEATIDHPASHLGQRIIFPVERPCREAELVIGGTIVPIVPILGPDGRTMLQIQVPRPRSDVPHTIRWRW